VSRVLVNWDIVEGERKPIIECPNCGDWSLGDHAPHSIDAAGNVDKSFICQGTLKETGEPCGFHTYVRLKDWNGGAISR